MKASVFIATSLDGFIARPDGGLDWLAEECEPHGFDEFFASTDVMVIGRLTYEMVLGFNAWPYGDKPVFVLTEPWGRCTRRRGPIASEWPVRRGRLWINSRGAGSNMLTSMEARQSKGFSQPV